MSLEETAKRTLGTKGDHLTSSELVLETYRTLGLSAGELFLVSLERRRLLNRCLHTLHELCVLAMLWAMSNGDYLSAVPYMVAGIVFYDAKNAESSNRAPLVQTYLEEIQAAVQKRGLGKLGDQLSEAISESLKHMTTERLLTRPNDLILQQLLESGVVGVSNPEVLPWLIASSALLLGQATLARKLFQTTYSKFLQAKTKFIHSDSNSSFHQAMLRAGQKLGLATLPINTISQGLRMLGFVLTRQAGLVGYAMYEARAAAGEMTSTSQTVENATQANLALNELLPQVNGALGRQVNNQEALDAHVNTSAKEKLPNNLDERLKRQNVRDAVIANLTLSLPDGRSIPVRALIDFDGINGAFHIFGRNGSGKSQLGKALAHTDHNHTGEVVVSTDSKLTNAHDLSLGELRQQIQFWSVETYQHRGGSFLERTGMNQAQAKAHLYELGFNRLTDLVERDLSQGISMSRGEQRMLMVISFLYKAWQEKKAQLLILDELYSEVDDAHSRLLLQLVNYYVNKFELKIIVITQDSELFANQPVSVRGATISNQGFFAHPNSSAEGRHVDAAVFLTESESIERNPYLSSLYWQTNPEEFIQLVINRYPDAMQVVFFHQLVVRRTMLSPSYVDWLERTHPQLWAEAKTYQFNNIVSLSYVCSTAVRKWIKDVIPSSNSYPHALPATYYLELVDLYKILYQYLEILHSLGFIYAPFDDDLAAAEFRINTANFISSTLSARVVMQDMEYDKGFCNLTLPDGLSVPIQTVLDRYGSLTANNIEHYVFFKKH